MTPDKVTLFKLIEKIKKFCKDHLFINHYGYHEEFEMDGEQHEKWIVFWIKNVYPVITPNEIQYRFNILCLGMTNQVGDEKIVEQDSLQRTMSDTLQIVQDFYAQIEWSDEDYFGFEGSQITASQSVNPQPRIQQYHQVLSGWEFDVSINVADPLDSCNMPKTNV